MSESNNFNPNSCGEMGERNNSRKLQCNWYQLFMIRSADFSDVQ